MNKIYIIIIFSICFSDWEFQDSKLKHMKPGGLNYTARGCIIGDCFNGSGTYKYKDGTQYSGDFKNELKHGYGIFIFNNQNRYIGEWEKDLKWGFGKYLFHTGQFYIGEYRRDERRGIGMLVFANKIEKYIGEFRGGEKDGWGIKHLVTPLNEENKTLIQDSQLKNTLAKKGRYIFFKNDSMHTIEAGAFNKEEKLFNENLDSVIIKLHQKYSNRGIILQYLMEYNNELVASLFKSENIIMECGAIYGTIYECPYDWVCVDGKCNNTNIATLECISEAYDCLGQCNGNAVLDECGVCNGNGIDEGACDCDGNVIDCNGECNGNAVLDECGVCNGNGINEGACDCDGNVIDCAGKCGGNAILDECGVCNGNGIDEGACDCDGNVIDCNGECNGNAALDECGVCNGSGLILCSNNKSVCNIDECQERGCDLPINSIKLVNNQIIYNTNMPIYGFEIKINNAIISYTGGGESEKNNFTNAVMGSIIIGRSFGNQPIESNCGTLIDIEITNNNHDIISAAIHNAYGMPQILKIIKH